MTVMTPERWREITRIFHAALASEDAERDGLLAGQCAGDAALRNEVDALLAAHAQAGDFGATAVGDLDEAVALSAGARLGPYRIERVIGAGGMGVVHLAERSDGQFRRRVAIKRVAVASPEPGLERRFDEERKILAQLDHPNIARLLDAGVDAAGRPYLVMEHVEGVPLTLYCSQRALGTRERLALFLKVCAAVQYAHHALVIHRDIKPGNILVTADGEPKLLDFGVAKVLADPRADVTATADRALTLDYASPEQVRGEPVTTASDVYSLGVVLYELLADRKPYGASAGSLSAAVRVVCEQTPPAPSQVAPIERRSAIVGDLDAVVAKVLQKAPAERYASVAELAADLVAHLDHRPVKARRPSGAYLARRFVRRHRLGTAVGGLIVVLLAGGIVAVLWQARRAERERARAQQRFDQVRALANYVIYDLQDGLARLSGATELRKKMVERSIVYVDSLAAEAGGDARLQMELAGAYMRLGDVLGMPSGPNLGDPEGALRSYGKARDLFGQVISRTPRETDARRGLGRLLISMHTTHLRYRSEAAPATLQEALAVWEGLVRDDPDRDENLRGLASAHFSAAVATSSELDPAHMEKALAIFSTLLERRPDDGDRKRNVALCHKYLAGYYILGDPSRALKHGAAAARIDSERVQAEPDNAQARLDYAFDLGWLGDYHRTRGQLQEAVRALEQSLALRRELWAADPADVNARDRFAYMLMKVAEVHMLMGRPSAAAPLLGEAIAQARAIPADNSGSRLTLAKADLFQGEVVAAAGGNPCPWYRGMAELLPKLSERDVAVNFDRTTAAWRDRALRRARSCPPGAAP